MGEAVMPTKEECRLKRLIEKVREELDEIYDGVVAEGADLTKAAASRDTAYIERNALVAFLSHLYPSWLSVDGDETREWCNVVFVDGPAGQMSWHIHESELPLFQHLEYNQNQYDGHTTEEKYERLVRAGLLLERAKK